ncbi:MAG TPA: histidinol-phosphate transaminase, partial [Succinivibrio sp.]|nr:histidinol-phosphate transaminase [Succinivibrio sp.]
MNFEKLITKHVQKLVPYLSARRIGGHGHNFLNANESPKSEGYFLNSSSLNRYPD